MSNLEIGLPDGAEDFVGADAQNWRECVVIFCLSLGAMAVN